MKAAIRTIRRKLDIAPEFHQTDMMGVVHNAQYFLWFERGRLQIMEEVLPFFEAVKLGIAMPVVENHCAYKKPARFGDPLVLHTTHEVQPAYEGRLVFEHVLTHARNKTEMACGRTVATLLDMRTWQLVKEWPADLWQKYLSVT